MENKYISLLNKDFCADFHNVLKDIFTFDLGDNIQTLFMGFNDNGQALLKVVDDKQTLVNLVVGDYSCMGLTFDNRNIDLTKEWIGYFANKLECIDRERESHFYINYISGFKTYREEYKRSELDKLSKQIDSQTNEILTFMKNFMTNY